MKVRCIAILSDSKFKFNEILQVERADKNHYYFAEYPGIGWCKEIFEIVEDNIKEYTVQEVLQVIEEGQKYKCTRERYNIKFIEKAKTGVRFIYANKDKEALTINDNARFTLVKQDKEITFWDAIRSYGKTVYSVLDGKINTEYDIENSNDILPIEIREILEGKWFIKCD